MKLQPAEVTAILKKEIEGYDAGLKLESVGTVIQVGDGVARVHGLSDCMMGELLEFPGGVRGLALNLEQDNVGVVLFGSDQKGLAQVGEGGGHYAHVEGEVVAHHMPAVGQPGLENAGQVGRGLEHTVRLRSVGVGAEHHSRGPVGFGKDAAGPAPAGMDRQGGAVRN